MARHLPPDSACALAFQHSPDPLAVSLLREIEHNQRMQLWDGKGDQPKRLEMPWSDAQPDAGDGVEWDRATDVWTDPRFRAALDRVAEDLQ